MNTEGKREAEPSVMLEDRAPESGVWRIIIATRQEAQRNIAEFVERAFGCCDHDQHHNKDAGQCYFGFHYKNSFIKTLFSALVQVVSSGHCQFRGHNPPGGASRE